MNRCACPPSSWPRPRTQAARLLGAIEPRFAEAAGANRIRSGGAGRHGYRLADISEPKLRARGGFGFLVPRGEGLRSLGTVFNSFLFPGRAPEQMASFTTFLGGATDTAIRACSDLEIAGIAHTEVARVLGIGAAPVVQHVARWDRALPQYNLGHGEIVRSLAELCGATPGLFLAGNYLAGPSMGACVEQANDVASRVAKFIRGKERADPSLAFGMTPLPGQRYRLRWARRALRRARAWSYRRRSSAVSQATGGTTFGRRTSSSATNVR